MQQKHETYPKTIKQWWHETDILPSELSELKTPPKHAPLPLRHVLCRMLPNNKPIVENKIYNLPIGVIKLMTPRTWSVHTNKLSFMDKVSLQNERPSLYWDLKEFFQSAMTVLAWPYRDKEIPLPNLGK